MTDKITFKTDGKEHVLPIDSSKTLRVGSVSPSVKLVVEEVPSDAMSDDPNERVRITREGAFLTRAADGRVYNILGFEGEDRD